MVSDSNTAKKISDLISEIERQLAGSLETVQQRCPQEEYRAYKKAVGRVVGALLFEILEPLYEKNPALKPPGWDD
jgi:hypothetical protein